MKFVTMGYMVVRKRVVRSNPSQSAAELQKRREHEALFGFTRGQVRGFSDFIRSHGVISLAVGIILGTAVSTLVNSLVHDVLNPLIGLVLPSKNLATATLELGSATVGWGNFVSTLIN